MPKKELALRLHAAADKGSKLTLAAADVAELRETIAMLAQVTVRLSMASLQLIVPPDALAAAVANSLCLAEKDSIVEIARGDGYWTLTANLPSCTVTRVSLIDAIDAFREANGQAPLSGVTVEIPGTVLYEQLLTAV